LYEKVEELKEEIEKLKKHRRKNASK